MEAIAKRKLHINPWVRQERAIRRILREGKHRNATELVRQALDYYLDHLGRSTLSEQARSMAEDYRRTAGQRGDDSSALQDSSRASEEQW